MLYLLQSMFDYSDSEIAAEDLKRELLKRVGGILVAKAKLILIGIVVSLGGIIYFGYAKFKALSQAIPASAQEVPTLEKNTELYVELSGAVLNPGVYKLDASAHIADLLVLGGGFTNDASAKWVSQNLNLAKALVNEQKVYIPFEWDFHEDTKLVLNIPYTDATATESLALMSSSSQSLVLDNPDIPADTTNTTVDVTKINVNTASQTELESLTGIGKVYAERIIANRPYTNVEELATKADIPQSTIEKNLDLLAF